MTDTPLVDKLAAIKKWVAHLKSSTPDLLPEEIDSLIQRKIHTREGRSWLTQELVRVEGYRCKFVEANYGAQGIYEALRSITASALTQVTLYLAWIPSEEVPKELLDLHHKLIGLDRMLTGKSFAPTRFERMLNEEVIHA